MPHSGRNFEISVSVPPYSGTDWTTQSPGRRKVSRIAAMADMPLDVTTAASESSSRGEAILDDLQVRVIETAVDEARAFAFR